LFMRVMGHQAFLMMRSPRRQVELVELMGIWSESCFRSSDIVWGFYSSPCWVISI
jgi:hypothetical protein